MKDYTELLERINKLKPFVRVYLKSKGFDINDIKTNMDVDKMDEIYKIFHEKFKSFDDIFKDFNQTPIKPKQDIIEFHKENEDGIYNVTVKLPGFNKTNTSIEEINSEIKIFAGNDKYSFVLCDEDDEIISTKMADGILTFSIQSKKIKNKVKKIIID